VLALGALGLAFEPGCGGSQSAEPGQGETAAEEETPVSEEGKKWGGWRWKGKRDNCFFLFENECYDSLGAACRAAKCGKSDCEHDDSAPAVVSCRR
jgi:hypothetical protein